jgi:ribosomal protein S18 acetylase RimI-like enzyme
MLNKLCIFVVRLQLRSSLLFLPLNFIMLLRKLTEKDASQFQELRLRSLQIERLAFASSHAEEVATPLEQVAQRLSATDRGVIGAFEDEVLCGVIGVGRNGLKSLVHKAFIWGMFVEPSHLGRGVGRLLVESSQSFIKSMPELQQASLSVLKSNAAAVRLYQACGFRIYGEEERALFLGSKFHDELLMQWNVK